MATDRNFHNDRRYLPSMSSGRSTYSWTINSLDELVISFFRSIHVKNNYIAAMQRAKSYSPVYVLCSFRYKTKRVARGIAGLIFVVTIRVTVRARVIVAQVRSRPAFCTNPSFLSSWTRSVKSKIAVSCHQQGHAGSKTLRQQNPPVLYWECRLTQVDKFNGCKSVGAFWLGRRCWSSLQRCYLHRLRGENAKWRNIVAILSQRSYWTPGVPYPPMRTSEQWRRSRGSRKIIILLWYTYCIRRHATVVTTISTHEQFLQMTVGFWNVLRLFK